MDQINEYIENKENIEDSVCEANFCLGEKAIKNFNGYCKHCFVNLFPTHPITIQASCKTKEQVVRKFINTNFDGFLHNKPIWTGNCDCTHRRKIDHRKLIGNTLLCIETDEKQHKGYTKKYDDFGNLDEEIRYDDIAMVHGGKFIFIRFNPDKFTNHKGVKINPILYLRLHKLKNEINKQIERIINDENDDLIEIIYLYYDNYNDEDINNDEDIDNNKQNIKNFNIKDENIYNNLIEINNKNDISYKKFMCYRCFYTSIKSNVQTHLLKKNNNTCKKNSLCIFSDEDIDNLNKNQFSKNYKLFKKELNDIIEKINKNFKYYKMIHQPKYIFNCYNCFYGTNIQKFFLNHFNNQNVCKKNKYSTFDNEEINNLNISQINNNNNNNIYEKNKCKCSVECKYTEEECKILNYSQFDKKKYDLIKKCYIYEKNYRALSEKEFKIYKCYKCFYESRISNIKAHINRKNKCKRSIECIYTDEECEILNQIQFDKNEYIYENAYDIITKCNIYEKIYTPSNEKEFINYKCYKCFYESRISNVKAHVNRKNKCKRSIECNYTDKECEILNQAQFDKNKYDLIKNGNIAEIINVENQIINNIQNQNNITNNHITINIDKLISFNDEWNLDNLKESQKNNLLVTNLMYTQLLKIILENEFNNNVIIENKESTHGLIFKKVNNQKQYEEISIDDIINESMIKLHKQLSTIYDNFLSTNENYDDDTSFNEHILKQKNLTNQKLNDFLNNKKIKNTVKDIVKKIYIDNKEDAILNQKIVIKNKDTIQNGY